MKNIWLVLILGIAVRIVLSFATFHPDIKALADSGQFVTNGHILNLYDYSSDALLLNYPPLIYWFFGLADFLFNGSIPLLKFSYLFFDIFLAFLLYKIVDPKKAVLAFSVWMFNPINLYATYMMGQFDIIPTFFTILALYFTIKGKLEWAALSLGGGIAFKIFPLFLAIPLIVLAKSFWDKVKLLLLTTIPYFLSILPYISSHSFRSIALFATQNTKSLYASIPISGGESILLFPASLILLYLIIWNKGSRANFWKVCLISLLLFFIFTHYHPQWLLWLTPFLVIEMVESGFRNALAILLIFVTFIISLFFFDPSLTIGLFSPIFPNLNNAPSIWVLFKLNPDYNFSRSLIQTVFVSSAFYLIYQYFPRKENG